MEERNVLIICIVAILCVVIFSGSILIAHNQNRPVSTNTTNEDVNLTLNDTQQQDSTTTSKQSNNVNSDPDYDPERDDSHQGATRDNPITVQQSDGVYTYYGPGHYDYYAGDNHMSGEYYKTRNNQ